MREHFVFQNVLPECNAGLGGKKRAKTCGKAHARRDERWGHDLAAVARGIEDSHIGHSPLTKVTTSRR
jgi:hypothetical protein